MECPQCSSFMIETNDFFRPKQERDRKKFNKQFSFLPQEDREYSKKETLLKDVLGPGDVRFENTVLYQILKLEFKKRLRRAQDIVKKFNSKERKTDIILRIDCVDGRYNLRFGHKDKTTFNQLIV